MKFTYTTTIEQLPNGEIRVGQSMTKENHCDETPQMSAVLEDFREAFRLFWRQYKPDGTMTKSGRAGRRATP